MSLIFNPILYIFLFGGIVTYFVIKSKWNYPPRERKLQFAFAFVSFFISSLITFTVGPLLVIYSIPSIPRLASCLFLLVVVIVSLISIFKPKLTLAIPAFWSLIFISLYFDDPKNLARTSYRDICNELRIDPDCTEADTIFTCSKPKIENLSIISKSKCVNTTGNDTNKFQIVKSPHIGKTITLKGSAALIKNLPRNDCRNRHCGYMYDASLKDLRNHCSNCLDSARLTTKLRVELIPKVTTLKVIGAFVTEEYSIISQMKYTYYILQDSRNRIFEVRGSYFEDFLLPDAKEFSEKQEIIYEKHFQRINSKGQTRFQVHSRIVGALKQFIKDFRLEGSVTPERIGNDSFAIIKDKEAFMTFAYFHHEWDLSTSFTTDIQEKKDSLRRFLSNLVSKPESLHLGQMKIVSQMLSKLEKEINEDYSSVIFELESAISNPEQSKDEYRKVLQNIDVALSEDK